MPPSLAEVERQASGCTRCALAEGRTQVVFGVGDPSADLMFIGEGPGAQEDLKGEPFVGRSGQLLDRLMQEELGFGRDRCFIANVVKCLGYDTNVQLGDGSWERIGALVRSRYRGTVMSVDEAGHLVPRRVVGWHTSPLGGRRLFRMTYQRAGPNRVSIELTGDHPVLTPEGFVPVEVLGQSALVATGQGLSSVARDVVYGTLLGDGHLKARSSHISFGHCARQAEYAEFKAGLLQELHPVVHDQLMAVVGGDQYPVVSVRTRAHQDEAALTPGPPEVMYARALISEVTDRPRADTTFFCIDVEDTHNFVTSGGVVHNCRPPGNRDPRPEEIAACRPWLDTQLDLINPSVVVTLGNFATRLLLGTTEPIGKLRGRAYPFRSGMLVPTFHPAAALRSGAMTVAHMRADLVRAKQILENY